MKYFSTEKREKITAYILKVISTMENGKLNTNRYIELFKNMSDAEFDDFMHLLRDNKVQLHMYIPNMTDTTSTTHMTKAAKLVDMKLTERVWMYDESVGKYFLSNEEYMVLKVPVRRASQLIEKKRSLPSGDRKLDQLSGQVTSESRASGISQLETQILLSLGLKCTAQELVKIRGGDVRAYSEFKRSLLEDGTAAVSLNDESSVARSAMIYEVLLKCMMIDSNIVTGRK